jgi:hypothetical protein
MTNQEKEALLKRIYALPTEWADEGGTYGKGGPVGSEDAALLWPEDVIDAINQFAEDNNVPTKQPGLEWVKTADRLPTKADAGVDEEIVTIYDDGDTRMMGVDYWKCVALVPGRFPYWLPVPKLPEVEG